MLQWCWAGVCFFLEIFFWGNILLLMVTSSWHLTLYKPSAVFDTAPLTHPIESVVVIYAKIHHNHTKSVSLCEASAFVHTGRVILQILLNVIPELNAWQNNVTWMKKLIPMTTCASQVILPIFPVAVFSACLILSSLSSQLGALCFILCLSFQSTSDLSVDFWKSS